MGEEIPAITAGADQLAFQDIFREYYHLVYGIAQRATGASDEAEDVAQEVFTKLYERWPRLIIRTSLAAWLARVTINTASNRLRGRRQDGRLRAKMAGIDAPNHPSAADIYEDKEDRSIVRIALGRLRRKDRACLLARYSGLSYREVAETLGVRVNSVGKILARAEARFKLAYDQLDKGVTK